MIDVSPFDTLRALVAGLDPDELGALSLVLPRPAWHAQRACGESDAEFFPTTAQDAVEACTVCAVCPVRVECATYAFEAGEVGVWGGSTDWSRDRARRAGLTVDEFVASLGDVPVAGGSCGLCGKPSERVDRRGRCRSCVTRAKRDASRRARAFAVEQKRRRDRGLKLLPAWKTS